MSEFEEYLKNHCDYPDFTPSELIYMKQVWNARQSEIDQLKAGKEHLAEMNQRYKGKMQEQQDIIAELKAESEKLKTLANKALDVSQRSSHVEMHVAQVLNASSSPEMLESEKQMNSFLTEENINLEAKVEKLKTEKAGLEKEKQELQRSLAYIQEKAIKHIPSKELQEGERGDYYFGFTQGVMAVWDYLELHKRGQLIGVIERDKTLRGGHE